MKAGEDAAQSCPGCGGRFPRTPGGPVHRYLESSPGCWAIYGEVLARDYSQPAYYKVHQFTVDTYAVQHPGRPSPQSIQSVALHLLRLCLRLEHGLSSAFAAGAMQVAARHKSDFRWLEPPPTRGEITVADVHGADSASTHATIVEAWANSAWNAWLEHHQTVRKWAADVIAEPRRAPARTRVQ